MTAAPSLQRSDGEVRLTVNRRGIERLREAGSAKLRMPFGGGEAILINTGGGLAGGDRLHIDIAVRDGATLAATTQAAERVYRSLGPEARVSVALDAGARSTLLWLPQETIVFDGGSLHRSIDVAMAEDAVFLAVESIVLGRKEMGERVSRCALRDCWRIRRGGKLVHAGDLRLDGPPPETPATLGAARAFATVILIAQGAEAKCEAVRGVLAGMGGASAWNGKLVARIRAEDGFALRKLLMPALRILAEGRDLPRVWHL